jgi:hypothetical protein
MKHIKIYEEYSPATKVIVEGSYSPRRGDYDGMHSFQSRRSDGFGGKMNTKVNEALRKFYVETGKNPEITNIDIIMDDTLWKVTWKVTIEESKDGKAWMGLTSRGGAGSKDGPGGSVNRAKNQIEKKKRGLASEFRDSALETKEIKDFGWQGKGAYIRQIFVAYTNPNRYPAHKLQIKDKPLASEPKGFYDTYIDPLFNMDI